MLTALKTFHSLCVIYKNVFCCQGLFIFSIRCSPVPMFFFRRGINPLLRVEEPLWFRSISQVETTCDSGF